MSVLSRCRTAYVSNQKSQFDSVLFRVFNVHRIDDVWQVKLDPEFAKSENGRSMVLDEALEGARLGGQVHPRGCRCVGCDSRRVHHIAGRCIGSATAGRSVDQNLHSGTTFRCCVMLGATQLGLKRLWIRSPSLRERNAYRHCV